MQEGEVNNKFEADQYAKAALKILQNAEAGEIRVTAIKLIDALLGKGQANLRLDGWNATHLKEHFRSTCGMRFVIETIIAVMLLRGHLKEDFHFTPYATIR